MTTRPFWTRDDLAASAFDPVLRAVQEKLARRPALHAESAAAEHGEEQFRRELARVNSLPRATQKNPLDSCADCGADAHHVTYRNSRPIAVCDECL